MTDPQAALRAPSRRDEIVAVATQLFAEKGFAATSTRDIADACGLLAGSLYSHFKSKAQILELAMTPFFEHLMDTMRSAAEPDADDPTGIARAEAMIRRVVASCAAHPAELRIMHYDWPTIMVTDELADLVARSTETLDLWHKVLGTGIEDGTVRASLQPEMVMRVVTSSVHGVLDRQRYGIRVDLLDSLGLDELTDALVTMLIDGLRASPPATPGS